MPLLFRNGAFISKMNTFCCSQYRSYKKGIPSYLHDRSREFVLHCLERRKIAKASDFSGITCQGKGLFFTSNLSECSEDYFGNEHEMPKCSCCD